MPPTILRKPNSMLRFVAVRFAGQLARPVFQTDSDGNHRTTPVVETFAIDPSNKDLSSKERYLLYVQVIEKQINTTREKLLQIDDRAEKVVLLDTLRGAFADRFRVDTAYQNLKLNEIQQLAKKLRDEVTQRAKSEENWVNAMTTLAEMRASGIDPIISKVVPEMSSPVLDNFGRAAATIRQRSPQDNSRAGFQSLPAQPAE